ncbi:MAG: putative LysR family transcriptional regulator [Proteobacteria bacterium]|nr:putative LysR family transcriptional regulator [Pseudomonadota bacterium]
MAILEKTLGVTLFARTTRRVAISEDGEAVHQWARKVLEAADGLTESLRGARCEPRGMLRISADCRLGHKYLAPVLADFCQCYPAVEISLQLVDRPVDLVGEAIDIDIRLGDVDESQLIAHRIFACHRILCAAPAYLERRGHPASLADLAQHDCLARRASDQSFAVWRLYGPGGLEAVKVTGPLSTNSAEVALLWAHAGLGVALVAERDVAASLDASTMVQILPAYRQPADVWAVCRERLTDSAKLGLCVRFLQQRLGEGRFALPATPDAALPD